ncbi:MAG: hypothetical protein ABI999_09180 [Acidobacteriota bacterium]
MRFIKLTITTFSFALLTAVVLPVFTQTVQPPAKPSLIAGDVTSVAAGKIVMTTKDGSLDVALSDKTVYKRVPPENPVMSAAVGAVVSDIGEGDKVVVSGFLAGDKRSMPARTVYLMTKSDIAQRNAKESEVWKTRGITGRVVSVDPVAKKINVETRTLTGTSTITLTPTETAKFMRYAPDSVKFSEAKASSLLEVQTGDMLRALGDKSLDGTSFTAEEVVTGAFQTVAGTVKAIDTAKNEVVITDLRTRKDVTVAVAPSSLLKKFPEEMATRMAGFQGGQGGVRPVGQGGAPPQSNPPSGQAPTGQGRPGFAGRGGGIDDMLDRFPTITAADLKVGDMIAVSSTKTGNLDKITAIKLLAGVEPFLRAAQASGGRQGGSGGLGNFNIPGLDGFGTP